MSDRRPPRAALYARVSTTDQRVDLQLDALRAAARERGWTVVGTYIDHGWSGAKESRPALDQLMQQVRRRQLDVVAVWRLDRLARSLRHLITLADVFADHSVDLVSIRDGAIDTTSPTGRLLYALLAAIAAFERDLLIERVRAGQEAARARGVRLGRPPTPIDLAAVKAALLATDGNVKRAAATIGVTRATFRRFLDRQKNSSHCQVSGHAGVEEGEAR